jgi:hypothetical protein
LFQTFVFGPVIDLILWNCLFKVNIGFEWYETLFKLHRS